MSTTNLSSLAGGAVPIGAIVQGQFASNSNFLPCNGTQYAKSAYPNLDTSNLLAPISPSPACSAGTAYTSMQANDAAYGAGIMVVVGVNSTSYMTSTDGVTFTSRTLPISASFVQFVNGFFFAMGAQTAAYSSDGINWASIASALTGIANTTLNNVGYVNGVYMLFGYGTGSRTYFTSTNLSTWTARTFSPIASGQYFKDAIGSVPANGCTHPTLGFIFAPWCAYNGTANVFSYSLYNTLDGVTWTTSSQLIYAVAGFSTLAPVNVRIAPDGGVLVACGQGTTNFLLETYDLQNFINPLGGTNTFDGLGAAKVYVETYQNLVVMAPSYSAAGGNAMNAFFYTFGLGNKVAPQNYINPAVGSSGYFTKPIINTSNGNLCFCVTNAAATQANYTPLINTSNFKTPQISGMGDVDRFYIRAQ